jgi:hypothetical protein
MPRKKPFRIPFFFLSVFLVPAVGACFVLATTSGADAALKFALDQKGLASNVRFRSSFGTLLGTYTVRGLSITNPPGMPAGSSVTVNRVHLTLLEGWKPALKVRAGNIHVDAPGFARDAVVKRLDGSLLEGVRLHDIEANIDRPVGTSVRVQTVVVRAPFRARDIRTVENGRLFLPSSDPVLFFGGQTDGVLDFQAYSKKINLRDILDPIESNRKLRNVRGGFEEVDLRLGGRPDAPRISGRLKAPEISYRRFRLTGASASLDLKPWKEKKDWKLSGTIALEAGTLRFGETSIRLEPGRFIFDGDPALPAFELEGSAVVQELPIRIVARGTPLKPEFRLSSTPQLPEEQLLVMLATGQGWAGTEQAIREGKVNADLAKEFIDYFLLGGSGSRLAHSLGIKEVSLLYDEETRGVAVKKDLSSRLDAVYGIETSRPQSTQSSVGATQKIGAEYKLGESSSVAVETKKSLTSTPETAGSDDLDQPAPKQSVTVEYKRKF